MAFETITLDEVNRYLGEAFENRSDADLIRISVNAWLESYLGRSLKDKSYTESGFIEYDGQRVVRAENPPVRSLTSTTPSGGEIDGGLVRWPGPLPRNSKWKIVYNGGFTATTFPDDLKLVCLRRAAVLIAEASQKRFGLERRDAEIAGSSSYNSEHSLSVVEKSILSAYRVVEL